MPRMLPVVLLLAALAPIPVAAEPEKQSAPPLDWGLDLRYRYEGVEQDGIDSNADANTLRVRGRLETRAWRGLTALLEVDHVEAIGTERYNSTRNGETGFPVVADPEGTDLNQLWLQFAPRADTRLKLGRQRLNLDNERFVGSSGWRQNEQTLDAFRIESSALNRFTFNYAYVDRVNRVFGPDSGVPPEEFNGASHLLNAKWNPRASASLVGYAYLLDFDEAPLLSSRSIGLRYDDSHAVRDGVTLGWSLEYARQEDAADNPLEVDAYYGLAELRLKFAAVELQVGQERLSGESGVTDPAASPAFQTPLATLHKWQGWADKFLTTPPAGIEDTYAGATYKQADWRAQAIWHDFGAEATGLQYGTELDLLVAVTILKRYEVLVKYADYRADEGFTDTSKFWLQLGASF